MGIKKTVHRLMEAVFDGKGRYQREEAYTWLRRVTGKSHVKDLELNEAMKVARLLREKGGVRQSTWDRLEAEKRRLQQLKRSPKE